MTDTAVPGHVPPRPMPPPPVPLGGCAMKAERGPSKDGKKQLSVFLTEAEYAGLVALADKEFRTPSQQARALIAQALRLQEAAAPAAPGKNDEVGAPRGPLCHYCQRPKASGTHVGDATGVVVCAPGQPFWEQP